MSETEQAAAPNESGRKVGHTEGPWGVSEWSGGDRYRPGFYVSRQHREADGTTRTEWMRNGQRRAKRFLTREAAEAAIKRVSK